MAYFSEILVVFREYFQCQWHLETASEWKLQILEFKQILERTHVKNKEVFSCSDCLQQSWIAQDV